MKKLVTVLVIAILLPSIGIYCKVFELKGLNDPGFILIDSGRIFVVDGIKVKIFSIKSFNKIGEFGKEGTGPGEFINNPLMSRYPLQVTVSSEHLLVSNLGRLFYFTKDGEYIKEFKVPNINTTYFRDFKGCYVAISAKNEKKVPFVTINLINSDFREIKELVKVKALGEGGKINLVRPPREHIVIGDSVYVPSEVGFGIKRFDPNGYLKGEILLRDYSCRVLTDKDRKDIFETFKRSSPEIYRSLKDLLTLPEIFPAIQKLYCDGEELVVQTWKTDEGGYRELYFFDRYLKNLKVKHVPFFMKDPIIPYPAAIDGGKLYQLVENEETEEWELVVSELK